MDWGIGSNFDELVLKKFELLYNLVYNLEVIDLYFLDFFEFDFLYICIN